MRLFVGLKENDSLVAINIQKQFGDCVYPVVWPNNRNKKIDDFSLFPEDIGQLNDYYLHYSGYQKIDSELLELLSHRAFNLHPAPPWYRGSGGLNIAIYRGEKKFGLTLHYLSSEYDDGQIIKFYDIELCPDENIMDATLRINNFRNQVFEQIVKLICNSTKNINSFFIPTESIEWEGRLHKISEIDDLAKVDLEDNNFSIEDLNKRIKAFATKGFPITLKSEYGTYKIFGS